MLDQLPSRFTVGDLAKEAVARTKIPGLCPPGRGEVGGAEEDKKGWARKDQKVEQGKSRATAASQKNK